MRVLVLAALGAAALTGCKTSPAVKTDQQTAPTMSLTSSAFAADGAIPRQYTCEGSDRSVPLSWRGAPASARSFALIVDDPDAPDPKAPKMTWVHWVLYDLPASAAQLPEAVAPTALPHGTQQGLNSWKRTGYGGPCPPIGRHRYFFKLFALDTTLGARGELDSDALTKAMAGHVVARGQLIGTYQKQGK